MIRPREEVGAPVLERYESQKLSSAETDDDNSKLFVAAAIIVMSLAVAVRLAIGFARPSLYHPDEIFQTLEQAHRLVYGTGLIPWEFRYGARSWLLPGLLAGPMWLAKLVGGGPEFYLPAITCLLSILSAATVLCAFLWGRRFFGVRGGLLASIFPMFASDLLYFGSRTLSEVVASHILIIGAYLLSSPEAKGKGLFGAGALLALSVVLRVQLLPASIVAVFWREGRSWRSHLLPVLSGMLTVAVLDGAFDALTWGSPFAAIWNNIVFNIYYDVSSIFGTEPWYHYGHTILVYWGGGTVVLLLLSAVGAVRLPVLAAMGIVTLAAHSVIAHKEYRFIYPAMLCGIILMGIGLAQISQWASQLMAKKGRDIRPLVSSIAALFCTAFVLGQAASRSALTEGPVWDNGKDIILASAFIASLPAPCGIACYGIAWSETGGYAHFHHAVQIYFAPDAETLAHYGRAANLLMYRVPMRAPPEFTNLACFGEICIAQRPGSCARVPMQTMPIPVPLQHLRPLVH